MDGSVVDATALQRVPAAINIAALAAGFGLDVKLVAGAHRGLFTRRAYAINETICSEDAFCWLIECAGVPAELHFSASAASRDVQDALLLQMAPYHAAVAVDTAAPFTTPTVLTRRDVVLQTMQANSFTILDTATLLRAQAGGGMGADIAAADAHISAAQARASSTPSDAAGAASDASTCALFSVICMCNHSCMPNARVKQIVTAKGDAPRMVLEARMYIPAGAELRISYVPRTHSQRARGECLTRFYGFSCTCERCTAPWDDTRVARCSRPACEDGRVYWHAGSCADCGAPVDACLPAEAAEALNDDAPLRELFDRPLPAHEVAHALVAHPLLRPEDVRVFSAMNTFLGYLDPANDPRDAALYADVASAIAMASMRTPYMLPQDLGIEVTEE